MSVSTPLVWRADGTPASASCGDVYRSRGLHGEDQGLLQSRHVFLRGCGLLPADGTQAACWSDQKQWRILETGFGLGLNFLSTWQAWLDDARRPERLFYSAVEIFPPAVADLQRSTSPFPQLQPLAEQLAAQWYELTPGVHRLRFADGRVLLTLAIHDISAGLKALTGQHDSLYLDGFGPRHNPAMWSARTLGAATRLLRPGAWAASWCVAGEVRRTLEHLGFSVERVAGLPPKRHALRAQLTTATMTTRWRPPAGALDPARAAIIGGGLAGAAVARQLADRGWAVDVYDAHPEPAMGASAVQAAVVAPHVSPDDCPLSELSRAGVRASQWWAQDLLQSGRDQAWPGVLEQHGPRRRRLPAAWTDPGCPGHLRGNSYSKDHALTQQKAALAGWLADARHQTVWHARAGWIRLPALVLALLQHPGIRWHGNTRIHTVRPARSNWQPATTEGPAGQTAQLLVIAAGAASCHALGATVLPLQALRGQVSTGLLPPGALLPPFPINGQGYLVNGFGQPPRWLTGSSFEPDQEQARQSAHETLASFARLRALNTSAAAALAPCWREGSIRVQSGVRTSLPDHLPAVGALTLRQGNEAARALPPVHVLTGLGAHGGRMALLCAELLVAQLHEEPLPISHQHAGRLAASRFLRHP